jgi:cellulose 1,4-beta-cellobiosidase
MKTELTRPLPLLRESNSHAFAFTPHPCTENEYHVCETNDCGGTYSDDRFAGKCDANGCDYNPYRMGNTNFYGKGKTVDTSKKFTYVPSSSSSNTTTYCLDTHQKVD